ncbi:protein stum homolog [Ptychodera flava]|uniref:protein stum homolog n=1 Tax=Ptychodera flava TaxID=63121 RepID=UPI00396A105A
MAANAMAYNRAVQEVETVAQRRGEITGNVEVVERSEGDRTLKMCVPMFPMCFAATCLIFNIIIPGSGSMLASVGALFCCNKTSCGSRIAHFCFNFWCGVFQLAFAVLIVGWIWSVLWGLMYVGFALDDDEKDDQGTTRRRRHDRMNQAAVYPYPAGESPPPPPGSPPPVFSNRPYTPPPSYNETMQQQPPSHEALVAVQNQYGQYNSVPMPQPQPNIYIPNSAQTQNVPVDYHTPGQVPP